METSTLAARIRAKYVRRGDLPRHDARKRQLKRIYYRDQAICCHCRQFVMMEEASREHVVPLREGGSSDDNNIKLAHRRCNR